MAARSRLMRPRRSGIPFLSILSGLMIAAAIGLFILELIDFTQIEDRIPIGVTVGGVQVGNLSEDEAALLIEEAYTLPVTLYYQDAPINLIPDEVGFTVNTAVMVAQARATGESGAGFWGRYFNFLLGRNEDVSQDIRLEADYQRNALRTRLEEIARIYDEEGATYSYDVSTLAISTSGAGYQLDIEGAMTEVDAALLRSDNRAVDLPIIGGNTGRPPMSALEDLILAYLDSQGFIYDGQNSVASVFILDLETGEEINIQSDVAFTAASTIKIGIMLDLFRTLNREANRDEAFLMANSMLCSNNSSSNRIMELWLGNGNIYSGLGSVSNIYQTIGARNSFLTAPFVDGSTDQTFGSIEAPETNPNTTIRTTADPYNQTTTEDMGTVMSLIYDCANYGSGLMAIYPDGEYTQNECRQMLELMSANDLERLLQAGIPTDTRIAHKNGWLPGGSLGASTGEAGIVFSPNGRHYVISVYVWESDPNSTGFERWPLIEEISRASWNYFNPESQLLQPRDDVPATANECLTQDGSGNVIYNYLPPYDVIDLNNINGWRDGTETTPQALAGEEE
jgi:beta-lactamase class A